MAIANSDLQNITLTDTSRLDKNTYSYFQDDDILYDQRKLRAIIDSMVPREFRDVERRQLLIYTLKDSCVVHPQDSTNNIKFLFRVSEEYIVPTK